LFGVELTQGKAICFDYLEFITGHFDNQGLSPKGNDSGVVFMGMVHRGSLLLHAILEESLSGEDLALSNGVYSGFAIPRECNVVTSAIPIMTMPSLEETPMLHTKPVIPQQTVNPQRDTGLLPERLLAY
jgi:hypothetical protein